MVANIEVGGGKALSVQGDMSRVADICRHFQETIDRFGQLDILVNNAGSNGLNEPVMMVADVTEEEFDAVFALNVRQA